MKSAICGSIVYITIHGLAYLEKYSRVRIFKLLRSPRIDSKEPIPPGCVA
jgi:hypothetical protein